MAIKMPRFRLTDISDADAAVGDVKDGKTFYAVDYPKKTGTLPTKTLSPANDTVEAGYYAATTLHAVDADLAAANIIEGKTIFGFAGTLALEEDTTGYAFTTESGVNWIDIPVSADSDYDIASKELTFDANSMAVAQGFIGGASLNIGGVLKIRLYMDGVKVAESAYLGSNVWDITILMGTKVLSGTKTCKLSIHNYDSVEREYKLFRCLNASPYGGSMQCAISIGSIKI